MIRIKTNITIKYRLHETSAPYMAQQIIALDLTAFDAFVQSKQAYELGGWILYEVDLDRIRMQHSKNELWSAVYLRTDIN